VEVTLLAKYDNEELSDSRTKLEFGKAPVPTTAPIKHSHLTELLLTVQLILGVASLYVLTPPKSTELTPVVLRLKAKTGNEGTRVALTLLIKFASFSLEISFLCLF